MRKILKVSHGDEEDKGQDHRGCLDSKFSSQNNKILDQKQTLEKYAFSFCVSHK